MSDIEVTRGPQPTSSSGVAARGLFIFRRDLRLADNTGLARALEACGEVIPCFVLDPRQIDDNPYFSAPAFRFMLESVAELGEEIAARGGRLQIFRGDPAEVTERLIRAEGVRAVFVNRDTTPFSRDRDGQIEARCRDLGVAFVSSGDLLLHEPEALLKKDGSPYQVFTPFLRRARTLGVREPMSAGSDPGAARKLFGGELPGAVPLPEAEPAPEGAARGGRSRAREILSDLRRLRDYATERDLPALPGTTRLSAHHKFGTLSVRETYSAVEEELGPETPLLAQLHWRDFFHHVAWHFPHVFGEPFHEVYRQLEWRDDEAGFARWCEGRTGFPIVDAGMRELEATGFMHNRARMIVASFLTKDLHLDWRWGERHFATRLTDYDPCVNNGSWQWAASTGCDAQPFFRVFNPWRQIERFDPECRYIKRWVPELSELTAGQIRGLEGSPPPTGTDYPPAMVDHRAEAQRATLRYRRARS